jgi:hypothetical protein
MPKKRKKLEGEELNVVSSLGVTYRATLKFFAQKDRAILDYYPNPFPHWARGERHFNLVSTESRRVILFEPNRFVVRAEGHPDWAAFEEIFAIAKTLMGLFEIEDLFGLVLVSVRSCSQRSLLAARERFVEKFLTYQLRNLFGEDQLPDLGVVLEQTWPAGSNFFKVRSHLAKLSMQERAQIGPVSYKEVGQKWAEFKNNAENDLYRTPHKAPKFGILADMKFEATRIKPNDSLPKDMLEQFYLWAKRRSEEVWARIR